MEFGAVETKNHPDVLLKKEKTPKTTKKVIAIGASTGGVEALSTLFRELETPMAPILIVQHIPSGFSKSFAERLNTISKIEVSEVTDKMELKENHAYLATGNKHLIATRDIVNNKFFAEPLEGPRISRHKPSVDILYRSIANCFGANALALIMTGMGDDGAICMREIYECGAFTIAQDEKSSVIFGMAKKAIDNGGISEIVSLKDIPAKLFHYSN